MANVAKSEPSKKRRLSSCENENTYFQKDSPVSAFKDFIIVKTEIAFYTYLSEMWLKLNATPQIEIDGVESEYFPSRDSQDLIDSQDSQTKTQPSTSKSASKTVKPKRVKMNSLKLNSQRRRTNERNRRLQGNKLAFLIGYSQCLVKIFIELI